jgi:hypothetical protein
MWKHQQRSPKQWLYLRKHKLTPSLKTAARHFSSLCELKVCQKGTISLLHFRWPLPVCLKEIIKWRLQLCLEYYINTAWSDSHSEFWFNLVNACYPRTLHLSICVTNNLNTEFKEEQAKIFWHLLSCSVQMGTDVSKKPACSIIKVCSRTYNRESDCWRQLRVVRYRPT